MNSQDGAYPSMLVGLDGSALNRTSESALHSLRPRPKPESGARIGSLPDFCVPDICQTFEVQFPLRAAKIVATSCDRSGQLMSCLSQYQEDALEGDECPVRIMRDGSTPERVLSWSTSESSNPSSNTAALPCSKAS